MTSRRALILGDEGFLGRHFVSHLRAAGWETAGMDIARHPTADLRRLLVSPLRIGWDLVVHAAAVAPHRLAIDTTPLVVAENLELDAVVFRWAATARPGRLLYLSSSAVYPVGLQHARGQDPNPQLPPPRLRETDAAPGQPGIPDGIYGWWKLTGEALAGILRTQGVPVTVVRPFSGYGTDQAPAFPFGAFVERTLARADPFEVWGDGNQTRDFIHVTDLVAAALAACDQQVDGPLNLCTGRPTSLATLAGMICTFAGHDPRFEFRTDQPTGVRRRVGDPTRMAAIYQPQVSLEAGIRQALHHRAGVARG
jgi:nucleoside-diphosphate-sugar epimerase